MPTNKGSREGSEQDALYSSQSSDDSLPTHYTIGEETKQVQRDSIHQVRGTCWITDDYLSDSYRPDREPSLLYPMYHYPQTTLPFYMINSSLTHLFSIFLKTLKLHKEHKRRIKLSHLSLCTFSAGANIFQAQLQQQ